MNVDIPTLENTVIKGGYCIGCGACASVPDAPIHMELDIHSKLQAIVEDAQAITPELNERLLKICPFSGVSANEDEIGSALYGKWGTPHNKIGYHIGTFAGHVNEDDYRSRGSSGGMGSWILAKLLENNMVDAVIHIRDRQPTATDSRLFIYSISERTDELNLGAKSKYYPIELSEVLQMVRQSNKRFALVGIPCFIKSVRLLCREDEQLNERIRFCVGLICGHLKSSGFAEMLAWENGVAPWDLEHIDFRAKLEGYGANQYGVTVKGVVDGKPVQKTSRPVNELYGTNWGLGFFKYKACDFCDDVVAETADITIGDAWLPQYVNDSKGTNVIVVRHPELLTLLEQAAATKAIEIVSLDPEQVVESQSSGFNHRREGLEYRLYLTERSGEWYPRKRVLPRNKMPRKLKRRQELRMALAMESHLAFARAKEQKSFEVFKSQMTPLVKRYEKLYKKSLLKRAVLKLGRMLKSQKK